MHLSTGVRVHGVCARVACARAVRVVRRAERAYMLDVSRRAHERARAYLAPHPCIHAHPQVMLEVRIGAPNHDMQLLLSKLGGHQLALQLLHLPFDIATVQPAETSLRAMLKMAYRLLKAMAMDFPLVQVRGHGHGHGRGHGHSMCVGIGVCARVGDSSSDVDVLLPIAYRDHAYAAVLRSFSTAV